MLETYEDWVVLHDLDGRLDCVDRAAAALKDIPAAEGGCTDAGQRCGGVLRRDGPGAAVDHECWEAAEAAGHAPERRRGELLSPAAANKYTQAAGAGVKRGSGRLGHDRMWLKCSI